MIDPFFMLAPIYAPLCLWCIFHIESRRPVGRFSLPKPASVLLAFPAGYGAAVVFLLLTIIIDDGPISVEASNILEIAAIVVGISAVMGTYLASLRVRKQRATR